MKISVCISTRRYGGLRKQIEYFKDQTFPKSDFELIIIDGLFWLREEEILKDLNKWEYRFYYGPPRELERKVALDHPSMRNDALAQARGDCILFFDDYQIPDNDLLAAHWNAYTQGLCCQGRQEYFAADTFEGLENMHPIESGNPKLGDKARMVPSNVFYTHNCSAPMRLILTVNGFDERFNGGTGGEDYNLGARLGMVGAKMVYNPEAFCRHMQHTKIRLYPRTPHNCDYIYEAKTKENFLELYPTMKESDIDWVDWDNIEKYSGNHGRSEIYAHPNFTGKQSTETIETWHDMDVMFCKCKICGTEFVIDSVPLHQITLQKAQYFAPKQYFDLSEARKELGNG